MAPIRLRLHRRPPDGAVLKRVVVSRDVDEWFVAVSWGWREPAPAPLSWPIVGANRGVGCLVGLSTGETFDNPRHGERAAERLERRQRVVSRRAEARAARSLAVRRAIDAEDVGAVQRALVGEAPGSAFCRWVNAMLRWADGGRRGDPPRCPQGANELKAREAVAKVHRKVRRQRDHTTHVVSKALAERAGVLVVEDMSIRRMTASAAGTAESPGEGVSRKSELNRSILDSGWGAIASKADYKLRARGGSLARVDPAYASQTCSRCGHVDAASSIDARTFRCSACGFESQSDVNMATNLAARYEPPRGAASPAPRKKTKVILKGRRAR